jgi:hypothetical protein
MTLWVIVFEQMNSLENNRFVQPVGADVENTPFLDEETNDMVTSKNYLLIVKIQNT